MTSENLPWSPFTSENGVPFLNEHHVQPLAGGDAPDNAVAICPNCRREVQDGERGAELTLKLRAYLDGLKP